MRSPCKQRIGDLKKIETVAILTAAGAPGESASTMEKAILDSNGTVKEVIGSLLFGAIGLTLLFSGRLFHETIMLGIVIVTVASVISWVAHLATRDSRRTPKT